MRNWKEFIRAEHALRAVDPDADDETLMALAADCLTAGRGPRYRPYIRHDPPCPLRHDWRGQNVVGITTTDREVARRWVIEVMRLGHVVSTREGGVGPLAYIREQGRKRAHKARPPVGEPGVSFFPDSGASGGCRVSLRHNGVEKHERREN